MEPFEVLAGEAAGHPVVPLPEELARIYGGDLRFAEECVYANFVAVGSSATYVGASIGQRSIAVVVSCCMR